MLAGGVGAGAVAPAAAGPRTGVRAADTPADPLAVTIRTLSTAVVPTKGRVVVTGTITNRSRETWTDLKSYLVTSDVPITTRHDLDAAADDPSAAPTVSRITAAGRYDEVGDLRPGASTSYRISVPRSALGIGTAPGVYPVGVQVLGASSSDGRDSVADGRARTFLPLVPRGTPTTRLSLVVPVRGEVRRGAAGRLLDLAAWQRTLSADGRLDRLLDLSSPGGAGLTWVVDPAVLDAAESVAQGNPEVDPGPTDPGGVLDQPSPTGTASATPSSGDTDPSAGASGSDGSGGSGSDADEPSAEAAAARAWLDDFVRQAGTHTVATVPYGDLDVASVLTSRLTELYRSASELSAQSMSDHGIGNSTAVIAPDTGVLPPRALRRIDRDVPVLLSDRAFPDAKRPVVTQAGRAPVVLTDSDASSGGPTPTSRYGALAVRQRVLSDAALHALSGAAADAPLVVSTPTYWNPGPAWSEADFFAGLDQPWLQLVDLPTVATGTGEARATRTPEYPAADRRAQVPLANLLASQRLGETGTTYGRLLTQDVGVAGKLRRTGMLGSSMTARRTPEKVLAQVDSTTDYVRAQMQEVRVEGPSFVMMSGESGPIRVTLVNGLDVPVRVALRATTQGTDLTFSESDPITLGPGKRTAVGLQAHADDIGVHAVTLSATDDKGNPIGSLARFNVRTSRVSTVIWVIMAVGGGLLFLAIAVRLYRRIRRRRRTHGPRLQVQAAPGTGPEPQGVGE